MKINLDRKLLQLEETFASSGFAEELETAKINVEAEANVLAELNTEVGQDILTELNPPRETSAFPKPV